MARVRLKVFFAWDSSMKGDRRKVFTLKQISLNSRDVAPPFPSASFSFFILLAIKIANKSSYSAHPVEPRCAFIPADAVFTCTPLLIFLFNVLLSTPLNSV